MSDAKYDSTAFVPRSRSSRLNFFQSGLGRGLDCRGIIPEHSIDSRNRRFHLADASCTVSSPSKPIKYLDGSVFVRSVVDSTVICSTNIHHFQSISLLAVERGIYLLPGLTILKNPCKLLFANISWEGQLYDSNRTNDLSADGVLYRCIRQLLHQRSWSRCM